MLLLEIVTPRLCGSFISTSVFWAILDLLVTRGIGHEKQVGGHA